MSLLKTADGKGMPASVSFNIALVPSAPIIKKAIRLSSDLKKYGGEFVLNERLYSTHITIYMLELPVRNLATAKKMLRDIAQEQRPLRLDAFVWRQNQSGYINVEYRKSHELVNLQQIIIEKLGPLRDGLLRKKDKKRLRELNVIEQKNIEKYGFRSVGVAFKPHLTITKLRNYRAKAKPKTNPRLLSFTSKEIGLFYLGEYGTCKRLVAKYSFSD